MGFADFFRKKSSGSVAKDRLKLVLVSDRTNCSPEIMEQMKNDKFNDQHHIGRFSLINKLHSQLGYTDAEVHKIMNEAAKELDLHYTNYYGGGYTW